ncbi:phosphoinositide 3-kinase C2 domain protein [Cooperia oncophora]
MESEEMMLEQDRNQKGQDVISKQITHLNKYVDLLLQSLHSSDRAHNESLAEKLKMSGAVAASSAGDDLPGPSGSRSTDFMGVEPRKKPTSHQTDGRMSRIEAVHRTLHGLHNEWEQRKRTTLEIDYTNPSLLCSSSSDAVSCIELGGLGERQLLTVLLPWMQVTVCCGFEFSLNGLKTELFAKLKRMSVSQFSMKASDYVFQVLRKSTGDMEELYNEEMLLSKIDFTRPYPMLSLFEPESFRHERDLAHVIGQALGYSLDELETGLTDELKTCRAALFKDTVEAVNSRGIPFPTADSGFRLLLLFGILLHGLFFQISVEFTVYCGKTSLTRKSSSKVPSHNPRWLEGMISFDLYMKDLPPAAVLTVHLVETKLRKGKSEDRVLGWVNIRLLDWRGELLQGVVTLNLWGGEPKYPPHGRIGSNDKKQGSSCRLVIELACYRSPHVRMPDSSQFAPFVRFVRSLEEPQKMQTDEFSIARILATIRKRLLGGVVSAEEELFVWNQRVQTICRCMDPIIRRFAVAQLDVMLDNQSFPLFILPFIQALKCEAWSYSPLSCLLLKKALCDYRIGHKLFWLLRAELANLKDSGGNISEMYKRFALIIEAYLRGNDEHIRTVVKQVEMVDYLHRLSLLIKGIREKDAATERFREELRNNCPTLEKIDSPLDPSNALGHLRIDKCRVLGSAKMPLLLSWQNRSPLSEYHLPTYEIIFKNGDDLRQDMLVLQMLELMDSIWKRNQLDCCLSLYPVLPMGTKYGMIGVVPNCSTIFEIQSEGGKVGTAVKSLETTFINRYIKNIAGSTKKYMECVDRFLMSCVGYSVGTFIMGIMDRHNDNIMMTRDGKLFHIDFGHILGHGKTKLGIRRDRVPFVLTEHFLCVIGQGRPVSKDSHEVTK